MDYQHGRRKTRIRRRTEGENTARFTQSNTQKVSNWKTPGQGGVRVYWFKKFTPLHDWLAIEMNRCLQETDIPERKDHLDLKIPPPQRALTTDS